MAWQYAKRSELDVDKVYETSNIVLLGCLILGFAVGVPAFLNQFAILLRTSAEKISVKRFLWGSREISWEEVATINRSPFGPRVLDLRLLNQPFLSMHRNYLLIIPSSGANRKEILEEIQRQGFLEE